MTLHFQKVVILLALISASCLSSTSSHLKSAQTNSSSSTRSEIGSPYGQVSGTMVKDDGGFSNGDPVCVAKFDFSRQKMKIYRRNGRLCDKTKTGYIKSLSFEYVKGAFSPWLEPVSANEHLLLDIRYSLANIFPKSKERYPLGSYRINKPIYGKPLCLTHPRTKTKLLKAAQIMSEKHPKYVLRILDCYRPAYVSAKMYEKVADMPDRDVWVAKRSGHNKGASIDLTLAYKSSGDEVNMGTPFDYFGKESSYNRNNALHQILRDVMMEAGFFPYNAEWWHFKTSDAHEEYLDLPI